jgi:hypothetical protein
MRNFLNPKTHLTKILSISEENITKKRLQSYNVLFGCGEAVPDKEYKFFNTFGKDFAGKFGRDRLS